MADTSFAELFDARVLDQNGEKIGVVGQVYLDDRTGLASWITVKTGLFGLKETFVPLKGAVRTPNEVQLPYTKEKVKDAPRVAPDSHLDAGEEAALFKYYELSATVEEPKAEPKDEKPAEQPKDEPKEEPKEEPKAEAKEEAKPAPAPIVEPKPAAPEPPAAPVAESPAEDLPEVPSEPLIEVSPFGGETPAADHGSYAEGIFATSELPKVDPVDDLGAPELYNEIQEDK